MLVMRRVVDDDFPRSSHRRVHWMQPHGWKVQTRIEAQALRALAIEYDARETFGQCESPRYA